jgi:predicted DNA-binding ribbon-helix-helix protein
VEAIFSDITLVRRSVPGSHKSVVKLTHSLTEARVGRLAMKSTVVKRSIVLGTRKTSVSLEAPFWNALKEIASERHVRLSDLVAWINADRQHTNFGAIRLFVLGFYRDQISQLLSGKRSAA